MDDWMKSEDDNLEQQLKQVMLQQVPDPEFVYSLKNRFTDKDRTRVVISGSRKSFLLPFFFLGMTGLLILIFRKRK